MDDAFYVRIFFTAISEWFGDVLGDLKLGWDCNTGIHNGMGPIVRNIKVEQS